MTPEDKPLFLELGSVSRHVGVCCAKLLDDVPLTADEQRDLGERLIRLGHALRERAGPHVAAGSTRGGAADPDRHGDALDTEWLDVEDLLLHAALPPAVARCPAAHPAALGVSAAPAIRKTG